MDNIIQYISIFSVIIPLLVGLFLFPKYNTEAKLMLLLLVLASLPQFGAQFIVNKNNLWALYNLFIGCEAAIWALLFYFSIKKNSRWLILVFSSMFFSLYFYLVIIEGIANRFFSEMVCLSNLIQVLWVSIYFYQIYKSEDLFKIELKSMFWFCMAILIYAPCTYFLFAFNHFIRNNASLNYLWSIHGILNTVYYLLIAVGFLVTIKNRKWKQSILY
jgi:hypothetical protein